MPKTKVQSATFRDRVYMQRKITIGDDVLVVTGGEITVTDPLHIEALRHMYGMTPIMPLPDPPSESEAP